MTTTATHASALKPPPLTPLTLRLLLLLLLIASPRQAMRTLKQQQQQEAPLIEAAGAAFAGAQPPLAVDASEGLLGGGAAAPAPDASLQADGSAVGAAAAATAEVSAAQSGAPDFLSVIKALIDAVAVKASGAACDAWDSTGTVDWYQRFFYTKPPLASSIATGMDTPVTSNFVLKKSSINRFLCPYRDFPYQCRMDIQTFSSTASTSSWNIGAQLNTELKMTGGVDFVVADAKLVTKWNFVFTFSHSEASASNDQMTVVTSTYVMNLPGSHNCTVMTTTANRVTADGATNVYISGNGWVGFTQNSARHWNDWDTDPNEKHYYRAATLGWLVTWAQAHGLPEGSAWRAMPDGSAHYESRADFKFDQGVSGQTMPAQYSDTSFNCTPGSQGPSALAAASAPASADAAFAAAAHGGAELTDGAYQSLQAESAAANVAVSHGTPFKGVPIIDAVPLPP